MFKNFMVICALLFGTSCFIAPVHAGGFYDGVERSDVWDDNCQCYLPKKIKTIGTGKKPPQESLEETRRKLVEMNREGKKRELERIKRDDPTFERRNNMRGHKWNVVKSPSFCAGYAKVKIEQHNNQYYKDMYTFYDSRISDDDMMAAKVDKTEFLQGYDMKDDDKIMECVEVYEKYRGFE